MNMEQLAIIKCCCPVGQPNRRAVLRMLCDAMPYAEPPMAKEIAAVVVMLESITDAEAAELPLGELPL